MAVNLSPVGGVAAQFFDNNGNPLTGGKLFTYAAGTTTPAVTFTSSVGTTPHTNPIILDAGGRVPGGEIWLTDGVIYKFVLETSTGLLIATYDNIVGINSNFVNYTTEQEIQTATAGQTVFNLTTTQYQPGTNSLTVYVDGVNQYGPGAQYAYLETDSDTVTFVSGLHVGASVKFTTATQTTGNATDASVVAFTGFNGQTGNVENLADDDGSDWIGFDPAGAGAVARSAQEKMRDIINVRDFGALGNGSHDDTAEIQAAINATPAGGTLYFLPGNYITSAALQINNPITLQGTQKNAGATILCLANDGIEINKVNNVNIYDLCIAQAVRYTTTPNSYTGILVQGDTANRPFNHCYRDVFIDGFLYGISADWIWSAVLDNVRTGNGRNGIKARYLSVNNFVTNCSFGGDNQGIGIHLDGLLAGLEGWMITNTLTFANRFGVLGSGATHIQISNCILDYNYESGILITDDGVNFGGNWGITNNYIAIANTGGISSIAGIHISSNTVSSQNRGCQISNNEMLAYGGATCPYGVYADNALANFNAITGNTFQNFSTYDIRVESENGTITGNTCLSGIANNILAKGLVANNTGTVFYQRAVNFATVGKIKITYDEAVPTTGTWNRGDICYRENPSAGGVPGWVCVSSGTPGTWKAMAALAA